MPEDRAIDERDIRVWFMKVDLEQARDTFRVVEGIIQTREQFQPARKKRSDAGRKRGNGEELPFDRSQEDMRDAQISDLKTIPLKEPRK